MWVICHMLWEPIWGISRASNEYLECIFVEKSEKNPLLLVLNAGVSNVANFITAYENPIF